MIKAGAGKSSNPDATKAGAEACRQALDQAGGKADLIIVFSTVIYDQAKMMEGVKSATNDSLIMGCSSLRSIFQDKGVNEGVVVMAIASDKIKFQPGIGQKAKEDSFEAGKSLAEKAVTKDTKALMVFLESVGVNGSAVVRGILDGSRKDLPIIGGMASDASTFTQTYQYHKGEVFSNTVVGLGISGNFPFGIGVQHGWESIGLPVKVTKAQGSIIQEIDNRPAIKFFEDYFGPEKAKQLYQPLSRICYVYPLGMSVEGNDELLIRNAFVATEKGEIICAGEVPQGLEIRLMMGDAEKAISAARKAAENARSQLQGAPPKAVLVFNCAARYMLLGDRADEEIQAIHSIFGKDVPLIGLYTYGEQAPLGGILGPKCFSVFHNETMALVALG